MRQTCGEQEQAKDCAEAYEREEVPVVAPSDTVVQPYTMVVLRLDAVVADATVMGARRAPYVAAFAVLGWDFHCGALASLGDHRCPFGCGGADREGVFVLIGWRKGM